MTAMLLAGGVLDPNLAKLAVAAQRRHVEILDLRVSRDASIRWTWDLSIDRVQLGDVLIRADAGFIRYDVFNGVLENRPGSEERAQAWFQSVYGWMLAHPRVRMLNREMTALAGNKAAVLSLAGEIGMAIPRTAITSDQWEVQRHPAQALVAKPVAGGDYCRSMEEALSRGVFRDGAAAMPAIVQQRLVPPELRVYVVGKHAFCFEMVTASLDYRVRHDVEVVPRRLPEEVAKLRDLLRRLRMDFAAADFKTEPTTGELLLLEVNSSPMFARFDEIVQGRLADAIVEEIICQST